MSTTTHYRPGETYFDSIQRSFANVPIAKDNDNAIPTLPFLEAAESLTTLFDVLGSVAFTPVKSDMMGNIKKIKDRYSADSVESVNLQSLVLSELKAKKHTATEGLLWLTRGLDFTAQSLRRNMSQPGEELSASFRDAYGRTLKQYHSFVVKPIFSAAMSATPYRKDFYPKLGEDQAKVAVELERWLAALEEQVAILKEFQNRKEAKW